GGKKDEFKLQMFWSLIPLTLLTMNPIISYHMINRYVTWTSALQTFYVYTINDEIVVWSALGICYFATVWVFRASSKDTSTSLSVPLPPPPPPPLATSLHPPDHRPVDTDHATPSFEVLACNDGFTLFMVCLFFYIVLKKKKKYTYAISIACKQTNIIQHLVSEFANENLLFVVEWIQLSEKLIQYLPPTCTHTNLYTFKKKNNGKPNKRKKETLLKDTEEDAEVLKMKDDEDENNVSLHLLYQDNVNMDSTEKQKENGTNRTITIDDELLKNNGKNDNDNNNNNNNNNDKVNNKQWLDNTLKIRSNNLTWVDIKLPSNVPQSHLIHQMDNPHRCIFIFYHKYIPDTAKFPLNLPHPLKKKTVSAFKKFEDCMQKHPSNMHPNPSSKRAVSISSTLRSRLFHYRSNNNNNNNGTNPTGSFNLDCNYTLETTHILQSTSLGYLTPTFRLTQPCLHTKTTMPPQRLYPRIRIQASPITASNLTHCV
ncbi:hypothetical protein RFI_05883, partial [Reticulomyxa filosa]